MVMRFLLLLVSSLAVVHRATGKCFALSVPDGGSLSYDHDLKNGKYPSGTSVTLSCSNSRLVGTQKVTCVNEWLGDLGHCAANCTAPEQQSNRESFKYNNTSVDGKYPDGTSVTLSCTRSSVVGVSESLCDDGKWNPSLGQCKAGCVPLKKRSDPDSLSYTNNSVNGKHPHGTSVTLSCAKGTLFGKSEGQCNEGRWVPTVGQCISECSQASARDLGYSGMYIDGELKNGNAPHLSNVELTCGEERHNYHCYDGTFLPKHPFKPCGACSTAKVSRLGYVGMHEQINVLDGNLVEGSLVALKCRDELHWFSCTNGELQPEDVSKSICACTPPSNTTADYDRYVFSTPLKDGHYESGTEVALFCKSGPVVCGSSSSTCSGGNWYPPLGRCPEMCSKDDLTKIKCENGELSEPKPDETDLQYHGGKASATCTVNSSSTLTDMMCIDGDWRKRSAGQTKRD